MKERIRSRQSETEKETIGPEKGVSSHQVEITILIDYKSGRRCKLFYP